MTRLERNGKESIEFCQCCTSTKRLRNMLYRHECENGVENYVDMLKYSFSLHLKHTLNQMYICFECVDKLRAACNFRERVKRSQETIAQEIIQVEERKRLGAQEEKLSNKTDAEDQKIDCFEDGLYTDGTENTADNTKDKEDVTRTKPRKKRKSSEPRKDKLPYKLDRNNLQCQECQKILICFKDLQNHMHTHYPNHVCHICGNFFATEESLNNHLRRLHTEPRFKCLECGKCYKQHNTLTNHVTTVHRGEKLVYKCTKCSQQFHTFHKRVIHMIYDHGLGDRLTYKCQECTRVFVHCSELRAHVRRDHRMERRFKCEKCDYAFFQRKMLNEHMICHSGERKFHCEICSKSFGRKDTLQCHVKTHDISKSCFVCGQTFTLLSSLKKHEKTHNVVPNQTNIPEINSQQ